MELSMEEHLMREEEQNTCAKVVHILSGLAIARYPEHAERIMKAAAIVLDGKVHLLDDGSADVESETTPGRFYHVNVECKCECPDAEYDGRGFCKHSFARTFFRKAMAALAHPDVLTAEAPPAVQEEAITQDAAPRQRGWRLREAPITVTKKWRGGDGVETFVCVRGDTAGEVAAQLKRLAAVIPPPQAKTRGTEEPWA
jgi:hypothetical protein